MNTYEVPDKQWTNFVDRFSRDHAGWPATIEVLSADAGPQKVAVELPLQGLSFDPDGSRPCTVVIGAGDDPSANLSHTIEMPLHIRVAEADDGTQCTVEIEPARGSKTLVHLHRPA